MSLFGFFDRCRGGRRAAPRPVTFPRKWRRSFLRLESLEDRTLPSTSPLVTRIADDTGRSATDGVTSDNTLVLYGTAEPGGTVALYRDGVTIGSATADAAGDWSFDYTSTRLAEGVYNFYGQAVDAVGNLGLIGPAFRVTVDRTAPGVPPEAILQVGSVSLAASAFSWSASAPAVVGAGGITAGRASAGELVVTVDGGAATAFGVLAANTRLPSVTLRDALPGGGALRYALSDVQVTSFSQSDASADGRPPRVTLGLSVLGRLTAEQLDASGARVASADWDLARATASGSFGPSTADPVNAPLEGLLRVGSVSLAADSFAWSASAPPLSGGGGVGGGGGGGGRASTAGLEVALPAPGAAAAFGVLAAGTHLPSVTLQTLLPGGGKQVYTLTDAVVTSYGLSGSAGQGLAPEVHVGLFPGAVAPEQFDASGARVASADWDLARVTASGSFGPSVPDPNAPGPAVIQRISDDTGSNPSDGVTSDPTLVLYGVAEANSLVTLYRDGTAIGTTTADASGNRTFDYTSTVLAPGTYHFAGTATDLAGNVSALGPNFVVVEQAAPQVTQFLVTYGNGRTFDLLTATRLNLPWQITSIQVVFNEAVTATAASLSLSGRSGALGVSGFSGSGTNTLTWVLGSAITIDRVTAVLQATGADAVRDAFGNTLNNDTAFTQSFNVLYGDVNGDGFVNSQDVAAERSKISAFAATGAYDPFFDLNGDGKIDSADLAILRGRVGTYLP